MRGHGLRTEETIIYVAGNPELYPLEYYDPESGEYQGAIPDFLARFAGEYGYDLRYIQPGEKDRREDLADHQQIDLISGCGADSRYAHTAGEPLVLFYGGAGEEREAYQLWLTQVAPDGLRSDLQDYVSRVSQAEWTGAVLQAAGEAPADQTPAGLLWGGLLLIPLLVAGLAAALLRLRRERGRKAQARLTDPVTGLGSREALELAFSRITGDQSRQLYSLLCFHLDLDRVGALWGQERALALLGRGADILRQAAGPADTLARSGGELLALKRAAEADEVKTWSAAAMEEIRGFFPGGLADWGPSVGICPLETEFQDFDHTLFHARQCALEAGAEGESCRLCGTEELRVRRERRQLLEDFQRGLEREEFQLYLQPFVDAGTFRVVGGEALSRWRHPRLGLLRPDRYIPLLEETGLIGELDFYGLEKVCAFLEELERRQVRDFFISCNFARKTFCTPDFARRCIQTIGRYSFPRKLLILEVTETQRLRDRETAQMLENIEAVRGYGARVIFDDFGVGFSTFHDLQDCPMDGLKLDKKLVDNMWTEKGGIILNALVETGHRMGMTILAEGVEEERQIQALRDLHCDVFQGFRFSVPLPAAEAKRKILEGTRFWDTSEQRK